MAEDLTFPRYGTPGAPSPRRPRGLSAVPFASGLGLGLLVLPLTALCAAFLGGGESAALVFVALTAGAMSLPPTSGRRVAGVVTGIAVELAAGVGLVVWYLATHEIRFG